MEPGSSRPAQAGIRPRKRDTPIFVADPAWRRAVPRAERIAARAACAAGAAASVILTSDRIVQRLNHRHRGRNKATNVLTFPAPCGEIFLALGVIRREAAREGRNPAHHLAHLVVHGALHLQGLDHHAAGAARRMEMQEARILRRLGLPNPWRRAG